MQPCEELKDDQPMNCLEHFSERDEVIDMIRKLEISCLNNFEKEYEKFSEILSRYQEQPHLLDPHLETLTNMLLDYIRNPNSSEILINSCFKYLYIICKVRTYKVYVKFLPHELVDLEFALNLLEKQNADNSIDWETRYILLLWMSILVINPFHMSRLDAISNDTTELIGNELQQKTKMAKIYEICKKYTGNNDTCAIMAAYLSAKFFIRIDVKDIYLKEYLYWVIEQNNLETLETKYGQLAAVAAILKHGKREDLLIYADTLLKWIVKCDYKTSLDFLKYKYYIKIIQRLGLVYLKPRLASWRYKRGSRSLVANLVKKVEQQQYIPKETDDSSTEDDEVTVPDNIEEVIEHLLEALRSSSSDVRWSAAKGLGRVTNRLSKSLGDEVVGSVVDILCPLEPNEAWHGACLALAELAKRGLLLPYRLKTIVPLLMQALFYDEMKGYMSVGQHIRDAACYMCWAFARAYEPNDLQPFIKEISSGLLTVAVFDREINCRRAASAAFQESVGRLGNFPYGIEISTTTDFFSVGLRSNSYLKISDSIAQYKEYTRPLIDHLIEKKINHWDTNIRELSSKSLHNLTKWDPSYMSTVILPLLFTNTDSIDIGVRHGSILAIGEILTALNSIENQNLSKKEYITNQIVLKINCLVHTFQKRDQFRGMSGEIMKQCCTDLIKNCSLAKIPVNAECIESWQQIIDKCIISKSFEIRQAAAGALKWLCVSYYNLDSRKKENEAILNYYIEESNTDLEEHVRMGYVLAIGSLPKFILQPQLSTVIFCLTKHSLISTTSSTLTWSEARRDSVKALANVIQTIGFDPKTSESFANPTYMENVTKCFLDALTEYTLDNRGDIGAWVREAAMNALFEFATTCPPDQLKPDFMHMVMTGLSQQAVEKIDRTRGLGGKLFCLLVHWKPKLPYIKNHNELLEIFPEDSSTILWLFAYHTFPLFCSMLKLVEYSKRLVLGLSASIGQLTESLIKYSSASLFDFLQKNPQDIPRICNEIVEVFKENSLNERVTYPMLNFLDILISSGVVSDILLDESSNFADEIFRLVNIEIKGHKKLYKLVSSINVFCQLIQVPRLNSKILSKMAVFLGLTHVHIRKTTATKLYEALALHGDTCGISEDKLDEILNILSENDWGMSLNEVRPIRNHLCDLMGIKAPSRATNAILK